MRGGRALDKDAAPAGRTADMIIVVCIDDQGGMVFHHRRQSQDKLLRLDLLKQADGKPVWMNEYSCKLFDPAPENIRVAEDFAARAGKGEYCFFEDVFPGPWLDKAEMIVVYRWNRMYPSDLPRFPMPLTGRSVKEQADFAGSSHERISKEIWV